MSSIILNVNDDPAARYVITRDLERAGFRVIEAENGTEALTMTRAECPELIVLDVNLPDIDGLDVCRRIKADTGIAPVPVLHISAARIDGDDRALGLNSGADGYLIQPVEPQVLAATVNALLRLSRAKAEARAAARAWEAVFGAITDGVCLIDAAGRVQRCNQAMATLAGRAAADVEGLAYADVLAAAYPGTVFPDSVTAPVHRHTVVEVATAGPRRRWLRLTAEPMKTGPAGDATAADRGSVRVVVDITDSKEAALRQRQFLGDILASVTEGKLHLCAGPEDLPTRMPSLTGRLPLSRRTIRDLRGEVRRAALARAYPQDRWQDLETAVGEAAMNAVVHAGHGSGEVCSNGSGAIQVWIEDVGQGIAMDSLHRATLERGYTTAGTLGHGFWIILKTCDRVHLLTGEVGTTVVLEQEANPPTPHWVRRLPS